MTQLWLGILLSVSPKQDNVKLTGIPRDYVEVGTDLDLNYTINRMKPESAEMYWMVGERKENGSVDLTTGNDDGTFSQSNILQYK